jgi:hypothetical protein
VQCGRLQKELELSLEQNGALEDVVRDLRLELQRAHEDVGRLMPDHQHQHQQQQQQQQEHALRVRELENEVEMMKIHLVMQQQRAAADLQNASGSYEASLAYLESRERLC